MITNEYINRAIDYILTHINETLSVDEIAAHCIFSRYYFSRMFKMETGEGIYAFIKRVKMEQSAFRIKIEQCKSITDVGLDYGYNSSNYSSAFKEHHGISPIVFRRTILRKSSVNPIFQDTIVDLESLEECIKKISIEIFADTPVIFERHKGNYSDLSEHWGAFLEKYSGNITEQTLLLERTYDDPAITAVDECLYDLCMTVSDSTNVKNTCVISGGKFAVYHFKDPVKQIYSAYQCFFNVWLPQSNYAIDDRHGFVIYRKIGCGSMNVEIDIYFPLK